MKKNLVGWLMAAYCVVTFWSCEKEDDLPTSKVPADVRTAFDAKFPAVNRVEWEKISGYYVADFRDNGTDMEAWYDKSAVWCMTETDLRTDLNALPGLVQNAFQTGQYADWRVDDIDKYERPGDTFYLVEIEKNGETDRDLFYAEDGTLLKDEVDKNNDQVLPNISFN